MRRALSVLLLTSLAAPNVSRSQAAFKNNTRGLPTGDGLGGSRGVRMGPHNRKEAGRRAVRRKLAKKSRAINRSRDRK
jgi:hypothetical protein